MNEDSRFEVELFENELGGAMPPLYIRVDAMAAPNIAPSITFATRFEARASDQTYNIAHLLHAPASLLGNRRDWRIR